MKLYFFILIAILVPNIVLGKGKTYDDLSKTYNKEAKGQSQPNVKYND